MEKVTANIFQKLVRDRIPEIIQSQGKKCFTKTLEGQEFLNAIALKFLEETYELFSEWQKKDKSAILKESADLLEIVLTGLELYGLGLDDLLAKRDQRKKERGAFHNRILLESIDKKPDENNNYQYVPSIVFNPIEKNRLLDVIKSEILRCQLINIASAFYSPGVINLLITDFENFIQKGGQLKILLSTMGNITRPEYLAHLVNIIPGIHTKIYHPKNFSFDQNPPNFHIKIWLFHHHDNSGAIIIGSSNFTEAGFSKILNGITTQAVK